MKKAKAIFRRVRDGAPEKFRGRRRIYEFAWPIPYVGAMRLDLSADFERIVGVHFVRIPIGYFHKDLSICCDELIGTKLVLRLYSSKKTKLIIYSSKKTKLIGEPGMFGPVRFVVYGTKKEGTE